LEELADSTGDKKLSQQVKAAEKESNKDTAIAQQEQKDLNKKRGGQGTSDEPPSADDEDDESRDDGPSEGGCNCNCGGGGGGGCGGDDETADEDETEAEKKVRLEKKAKCRAKHRKEREEEDDDDKNSIDQQLLDVINLGAQNVEAAYQRLQAPPEQEAPPPPLDPIAEITKAAIKLGAKIDPATGYLEGFKPVSPEDVISGDDDDQLNQQDECHKKCKCHKKDEGEEDDAVWDAIEKAVSDMGDTVTDDKMKCTMCQFFVGKVNKMFARAAQNAPIFLTESEVRSKSLSRRAALTSAFNSLPQHEQVLLLSRVAIALVEQQATHKRVQINKQQAHVVIQKVEEKKAEVSTKAKAKCPGDGCDNTDDGIGSLAEEVKKAEEKGIKEGVEKEKEKVEESKGELEPKEPENPVKPPTQKEREKLILTGEPPERGVVRASWWLANDMFDHIKPLVYHKFQDLCKSRVPGSYADFCQPLYEVYDDITSQLRSGNELFDICLKNKFCADDMAPPAAGDAVTSPAPK
jgi:hypothetical protein